jgi:hypothetical protein
MVGIMVDRKNKNKKIITGKKEGGKWSNSEHMLNHSLEEE